MNINTIYIPVIETVNSNSFKVTKERSNSLLQAIKNGKQYAKLVVHDTVHLVTIAKYEQSEDGSQPVYIGQVTLSAMKEAMA